MNPSAKQDKKDGRAGSKLKHTSPLYDLWLMAQKVDMGVFRQTSSSPLNLTLRGSWSRVLVAYS